MKETPILFTPENVRKVLAGTKTQTRRIMKPRPDPKTDRIYNMNEVYEHPYFWCPIDTAENGLGIIKCPYGWIGDRLWVRETWDAGYRQGGGEPILVAAHIVEYERQIPAPDAPEGVEDWCLQWKRKPSIHMPKWAARLWLELTVVRVERLQEISEKDALAEGCQQFGITMERAALPAYRVLWESINGIGSWEKNPWVWVLEFKQVQPMTLAHGEGGVKCIMTCKHS